MSFNAVKPALHLREKLAMLDGLLHQLPKNLAPQQVTEGDGVQTEFSLPRGYRPYAVYNNGVLMTEGAANDYTVKTDVTLRTVVFAVAPANGNPVSIWPVEA